MTATHTSNQAAIDHVIGPRGQLTVQLAAAELRLVATDGDRVVVRAPDGDPLPQGLFVEANDDSLTIRNQDKLGLVLGIGRRTIRLEIDVPAAARVLIQTASGWTEVHGLVGDQRYRTVAAATRLVGCAGEIELETVSGDATIDLGGETALRLKSVSGDILVAAGRLNGLRVGTTSGDVRIDSPLISHAGNVVETLSGDVTLTVESGIRVDARTVSGDLSSELPHRSEGRMGRRTLVVGDGSIQLDFRSVSGDLHLRAAGATEPSPASVLEPVSDADRAPADEADSERLTILRALERGELDVATAMTRLAALDDSSSAAGDERMDTADA